VKPLALKPIVSEKGYGLSQLRNTYVFKIGPTANRQAVAKAVTDQFKVEVSAVRLAGSPSKTQRTVSRGRRTNVQGVRSPIRKAYVTLKEGHSLPIFAESDDKKTKKGKE